MAGPVNFGALGYIVPLCTGGFDFAVVHIVGSNVLLLIQNRDGGESGTRSHVGQHHNLDVVTHEKPRLLKSDAPGNRVRISHGRGTHYTVRYTANESLDADSSGVTAAQVCSAVIGGNARDKVPIPGRGNVLVLVSGEVCVQCSIR